MTYSRITATTTPTWAEAFLLALEEEALSVSWYETEDEARWRIEGLYDHTPDLVALTSRLELIAVIHGAPLPELHSSTVEETDWLEAVWKNFPPQTIGRYYIYGSYYNQDKIPNGLIGLEINAATAFGSGEHETTQGCLKALNELAQTHQFTKALDMGCGSGVLALAIAKTWKIPTMAVDNDPEAIRVAQNNAILNQCEALITTMVSEGFADSTISKQGSYPLIVANILAKPLCMLAPDMVLNLAKDGFIILSGLLDRQTPEVIDAYVSQGLSLIRTYPLNNWTTLLLKK